MVRITISSGAAWAGRQLTASAMLAAASMANARRCLGWPRAMAGPARRRTADACLPGRSWEFIDASSGDAGQRQSWGHHSPKVLAIDGSAQAQRARPAKGRAGPRLPASEHVAGVVGQA